MIGKDTERGTYYVQYKYKDVLTGKWHTTKKRGFKKKEDAKQYEANLILENTKDGETGARTFMDMCTIWENTIESSKSSRIQHKQHFEIRFAKLKDKPIKNITKAQLIEWRQELSKSEYSTKTKNITLGYVRSVFKFASEIYRIPNVSAVLKNFKKTKDEKMSEMQVWTIDEFNQFIACVDNPIYKTFFETLFWTGCRRGEAIALQCNDLEDKMIHIRHSQRSMKEGLKPTKTGVSRKVRIDDELYQKLLELKNEYKQGYLFGGEISLAPTTIDAYFKKAIEKSGVHPIRIHDLRHSHATVLINNGVNIVAVSKRLGHADINETLKTYTHLLNDTDEQMMNMINNLKK